jgi:hypothetical protein
MTEEATPAAAAADADVNVNVQPDNENASGVSTFDPTISDNLLAMLITQAQQELSLNMSTARNLTANAGAALTLGVQQINAACLTQLFRLSPLEAQALGLVTPPAAPQT